MIKKLLFIILCLQGFACASVIDFVDVFVGTQGDHGQLYPGATLPFGLVKLSPDTTGSGHAGYDYSDVEIEGFSHTRLGGVGCNGAGGDIKVKPALGKVKVDQLDKSTETGHPGYYSVCFSNGIKAEFTVSYRVGFHKYLFPESKDNIYIYIDPSQSYAGCMESKWFQVGDNTLAGYIKGKNVCGKEYYKLYYAVQFDSPYRSVESDGSAVWCRFSSNEHSSTEIKVKVSLSPISSDQALFECENDIPGWNFESARSCAEQTWEDILGKVEIRNVPEDLEEFRDLFYTCLYRCFLLPHNLTSSTGEYRMAGDEQTIRSTNKISEDFTYYCGWSVWDDYRKFSLISLLAPDISKDITRSIIEWFKEGNTPAWAGGYWPCPSVRNEFINTVVLDAYQKGLIDYDIEKAYAGLVSSVQGNEQVEKPYQNYIVMKFAELLGKTEEAEMFRNKAMAYKKYWVQGQVDGEGFRRGFFTADGRNVPQEKVNEVDAVFYEGNLWHYRFFVPHDIHGLANLRGSRDLLADDLEYYFETNQHMPLNEPPLAYPFLFNYLGRPDRTQYWSRVFITDIVNNIYHNHGKFDTPVLSRVYQKQPDGWLPTMDDDTGAMSSQFVFSALGLYPACMGDPYYVIGSPLFPEVVLHLRDGDFVIRANNSTLANKYLQSIELNGSDYEKNWISYDQIKNGGKLSMEMGCKPNLELIRDADSLPPSLSELENAK